MGVPKLEDYDGDVQSYQQDVDDYFAVACPECNSTQHSDCGVQ